MINMKLGFHGPQPLRDVSTASSTVSRPSNKPNPLPAKQNQAPSAPTKPAWPFAPGARASSWKDTCSLGRKLDDACKLAFVPPLQTAEGKVCAQIFKDEIDHNVLRWSNTLVGYVLGDGPFYNHLKHVLQGSGIQLVLRKYTLKKTVSSSSDLARRRMLESASRRPSAL